MGKILVTGASGQLGSALVKRLVAENYSVRVILRPNAFHHLLPMEQIEVIRGSFYNSTLLDQTLRDVTTVFHIAGVVSYATRMDNEVYRINVDGAIRVVEASVQANVTDFILTSSVMAIGVYPGAPPAVEEDPFPSNLYNIPYADSKRLSERYTLACVHRGMRVVAVCPSTIIGPGDRLGNFRRLFQLARRRRLFIAPPGITGVVDVEDVVTGHLLAWQKGASGRRYILNAENVSLQSLCTGINKAVGHNIRPAVVPRRLVGGVYACLNFFADVGVPMQDVVRGLYIASTKRHFLADRAHEELEWSPTVGLEESLQGAARYFANYD